MKRTLSLILALMMTVTVFAAIPVSALDPEGTLYYEADYAGRYAADGRTEAVSTDFLGFGITPINQNLEGKNITSGNFYSNLTSEGLKFGNVYARTAGFVLKQYDLTQHQSYTIDFDLSINTPATDSYLYFGFGYNGKASYSCFDSITNFRYNGGSKLVVNGNYVTDGNAADIWKEIVTNHTVVNYQFVVENNKLTHVIVSAGDLVVDYSNSASPLDASKGTFGVALRAAAAGVEQSCVLKDFTVTVGNEKVYDVNFADVYSKKGLTEDTDALSLTELDLGVVNKVYSGKTISDADQAKIKTQLTANGFYASNVANNLVGALINGYDLSAKDSYNLVMEMAVNIDVATAADFKGAYLYFGYGYNPDAADHNCYASGTNFRYNGKLDNASAHLAGVFTSADNAGQIALFNQIVNNQAFATYTFVVENNKMVKVIVKAGDTTVEYKTNTPLDASKGSFGVTLRTGTAGANPSLMVKKVQVTSHIPEDAEPIVNILLPGRLVPTYAEKTYADEAATKYKTGYVLHNIDFSKVTDFNSTNWFVTNDKEPVGFQIKNGALNVITNSSDGVKIMFTGNDIPQYIQNYTVTVKYRFVEPSASYLCYIQSNTLDSTKGTTSAEKNTCLRYTGVIDNAQYVEDLDAYNQYVASMQAGEWITVTLSAMDRELINITTTCGNTTLHYLKTANTVCNPGTNMGLMVGRGSNIDIASVCVVAGYVDDITTLTWPGAEGALVQTVTADAVQEEEPPIITDEPTEEPPVVTEKPTEEITKAPTAEVTKPATTTGTSGDKTEKKGCGSSVAVGAIAMVLALAPVALKRRKED